MFTQWVFSGLLLVAGCSSKSNQPMVSLGSVQSEGDPLAHDLQRIWSALPGEYSNHEQVLQQQYAGEEPYKELHHVFVPVEMPRIGKHVLFVQQHMKGMEKPYRTRLYHLVADTERSAIRLDIYKLADEAQWYNSFNEPAHLRELSENAEFERIEGCSVFWTRSETGFKGHTEKKACGFWSEQRKQTILVEDNLNLNDDVLTIQDVARDPDGNVVFGHPDGPPHINRRLRYFGGWAVVREGGPNYDRDAPEWRVHRGLKLHSEGGQIELLDAGGDPIPYRIELARLTRSSSQTHLLKLALVDIDTDKTVAYTWTDPNTERIGMNIGWAQVGLTAHGVSPHLGFDSEETSTRVST